MRIVTAGSSSSVSGQPNGFADKVAFIWSVADLLRGDFKARALPGVLRQTGVSGRDAGLGH
jgi:hypothetical protein